MDETKTISIEESMDNEIERRIDELSQLELGSEKYIAAVKGIAGLYNLRLDQTKMEIAYGNQKDEIDIRKAELEKEELDRKIRNRLAVAEIGAPLMFYAIWFYAGFKFETTGNFTSGIFKEIRSKFKPAKIKF